MKNRDYAKRYYKQKKKNNRPKIVFIILLVILIMGAGLGLYMKLHPAFLLEKPAISAFLERLRGTFPKQQIKTLSDTKQQKTEDDSAVHFSFYKALPNMHVEVEAPTAPKPPILMQTGYILQFDAFKQYSEASQLRLSLLLAGIETEIEKIEIDHGVIYRVQQGPFPGLAQAKSFQQKWHRKGVDTSLKKI